VKFDFVANLPLSLPVKEFSKSVNIWGNYGQEFGVLFFLRHSVYHTGKTIMNTHPRQTDIKYAIPEANPIEMITSIRQNVNRNIFRQTKYLDCSMSLSPCIGQEKLQKASKHEIYRCTKCQLHTDCYMNKIFLTYTTDHIRTAANRVSAIQPNANSCPTIRLNTNRNICKKPNASYQSPLCCRPTDIFIKKSNTGNK